MAQIREIRRRIKSVKNTSKVTHAMELISAVKMRKGQDAAVKSRPYSTTLLQMLSELSLKVKSKNKLLQKNTSDNQMVILITTDRGLVGGLNLNLFKELTRLNGNAEVQTKYIVIGKKGLAYSTKAGSDVIATFISNEHAPYDLARILSKMIIDSYTNNEIGHVHVVFQEFISTVKQMPKTTTILPIHTLGNVTTQSYDDTTLFEPNAEEILDSILPHYVLTEVYQVLLEAKASEHSARMVAMKNATDAAHDLADDLTLTYNQARQEAVTAELLDAITAKAGNK